MDRGTRTRLGWNDLSGLSYPELRDRFDALFESPPHKRASALFLRSNIAWALQARTSGNDPQQLRRRLIAMAGRPGPSKGVRYKPGTRLIREWQGEVHEVTVLDKGYRWQGQHYRSLSRIAKAITGAHWSGPRFFGTVKARS